VELPITLPQDHTLFAILGRPDAELWLQKARHIRHRGGMLLVLTHPDYATDPRVATGYRSLLTAVAMDAGAWHALPGEVAAWWRRRAASTLRQQDGRWEVVGPAAGRGGVRFGGARARAGVGTSPT
jgi:hypothetical protein